ncbi:MAG: RNA polymerase sigma factor [Planctomycetota bacterium]|jgi:RNA polymerase sigma-70 factor (ECF subfamily)
MKHRLPGSRFTAGGKGDAEDDAIILDEIAHGNLEHFERFVERYKRRLFGYIRSRVGDAHWAEDLTQEVFLRAFRAGYRGVYDGHRSARTWLFTIANNCVIDFLRAKRSKPLALQSQLRRQSDDADAITLRADRSGGPATEAIRSEDRRRTEQMLERLPEAQRAVVALKVYGGLKFAEIAEVLGANTATVKSQMRYALDKIQRMLPPGEEAKR